MQRSLALTLPVKWTRASCAGHSVGLLLAVLLLLLTMANPLGLLCCLHPALAVGAPLVHGLVLGSMQWDAMCDRFPSLSRQSWLVASVLGVVPAWFLVLLLAVCGRDVVLLLLGGQRQNLFSDGAQASVFLLLDRWQSYWSLWPLMRATVLGAMMGLVSGTLAACPQGLALRRAARGAWRWLPAGALAWALGMAPLYASALLALLGRGYWAAPAMAIPFAGALVGLVQGVALGKLAGDLREA
jgi:hypothetical protein